MSEPAVAASQPDTPPAAPSGLGRALLPLHAVVERGPLCIEEIAAATGLPLSTAYRRVEELRRLGYLQRLPLPPGRSAAVVSTRQYEPGPRMRELTWWAWDVARPSRMAIAEDLLRRGPPRGRQPCGCTSSPGGSSKRWTRRPAVPGDEAPGAPRAAHEGPFGRAEEGEIPDVPEFAETVCHWLINAPVYHPAWSQYLLVVVRLRDGVPGFGPPKRQFEGTTHELHVVALNPDHRLTVAELADPNTRAHYLTPINIAEQFIATDAEMQQLADLAAQAVVNGHLNPETADAPATIRRAWLTSLTKTLAHIRGEAHAS